MLTFFLKKTTIRYYLFSNFGHIPYSFFTFHWFLLEEATPHHAFVSEGCRGSCADPNTGEEKKLVCFNLQGAYQLNLKSYPLTILLMFLL